MLNHLTTTQTLAALIGLYFLSAGIGMMFNRDNIASVYKALIEQPVLVYLGAVIAFAIGGTIVAVHNYWSGLMAAFVSFIGWVAMLEGAIMLACGRWFLGLIEPIARNDRFVSVFGTLTALLGVILLWAAFAS